MNVNAHAEPAVDYLREHATRLRVERHEIGGVEVIDCGVAAHGGIEAGTRLAEACMAGLASVRVAPGDASVWPGPWVTVETDCPVAACMASQYAGWEVSADGFFAMASGPFRAAAAHETLFEEPAIFSLRDPTPDACVGVLEASELPPPAVCRSLAEKCGVGPAALTLIVAPTNSQAGTLQVVARSVETAMHKLHELGFDLSTIESAWGTAPLAPVAGDALAAIGRTNDAILYGGHAVLYVRGADDAVADLGPKTPSSSSADHGRPFRDVFAAYDHDFYRIDKLLFSPAMVTFVSLDSGQVHRFGKLEPELIAESFGVATP
ncbi:MAG: methenyltetrahydromethanopterin cyclohydrolase [Planctomycetota bacterium]